MPCAYAIVIRERTRDAAKIEEYRKLVPATFKTHPATFLARNGRFEVLEGAKSDAVVIIEFPSYEAAEAWYHSPEYQAAREVRRQAGDYHFILTEGLEET